MCKPKYVKPIDFDAIVEDNKENNGKGRIKREEKKSKNIKTKLKNKCPLVLVADYQFFKNIGLKDDKLTISFMVKSLKIIVFTQ